MLRDFTKYGLSPFGRTPTPRQLAHIKLEKKAFFHFGVNTYTDLEWGLGDEKEKLFDPTDLDCEQWIRGIKAAGFKLAIITAKHHDGFCLWPSKYTEHSVKNSPYKNGEGDVIREFTDACHKHGILAGIYISPWDRSVKEWGTPEYSKFFAKQLTELLSDYGRIDEVWWDGAGSGETPYDWELWAGIVRTLQPTASIFGSNGPMDTADLRWVGNERGVAGTTHYGSINCECLCGFPAAKLNTGDLNGSAFVYSECDVSIRPGWFYHEEQDSLVKNPRVLDNIWFTSVGRNSNLLLNFPPDRRGLVKEIDLEYARISNESIEKMLSVNLAADAIIAADTTLAADTGAENLVLPGDAFYAAEMGKREAVIEITLPCPREMNVLILGEVIELGERAYSFRLEDMESGRLLCEGTSIGYCRAVRFDKGTYSHLRLTVNAADTVLLDRLGLHLYEEPKFELPECGYGQDFMTHCNGITFSPDRCSAELIFNGIYEFNTISFRLECGAEYEIFAFDGTNFHPLESGKADTGTVVHRLSAPEGGSYRLRVDAKAAFVDDGCFRITYEK